MRPRQFGVTVHDKSKAQQGFTLYTPLNGKATYLIDMDGKVVHEWAQPDWPGAYGYLLENGNLLSATRCDSAMPFHGGGKGGRLQEMDWDGNVVWEYIDEFQHHDFRRCPNGNTIYLGWERMPDDKAALVKGGFPGPEAEHDIYSDYCREVNPAGETVWEWHAYSDMDIEEFAIDPLMPKRIYNWCNTCQPLDNGDVLLSMRHFHTIAVIDRETKKMKWHKTDPEWGHQHDCKFLPNGNIILFANGLNTTHAHAYSFIQEFNPETDEVVWEYKEEPCNFLFSHHISGVDRLDNGNTLICEGSFGRIFEVTPEGETVWEFINPNFYESVQGELNNWVFRGKRYTEDSPEIAGRVKL